MTTMLNKAAWALSRLSSHGEMPDGTTVSPEDTYDFTVQVRAALTAIREPTVSVAAAGQWHWLAKIMGFSSPTPPVIDCVEANRKARENFTAMIDAILNETDR
jgi:hypothetical protein